MLQRLHILTREGRLNQDSRRKLKQVYHLVQFIEKILRELPDMPDGPTLADHGAGNQPVHQRLRDHAGTAGAMPR